MNGVATRQTEEQHPAWVVGVVGAALADHPWRQPLQQPPSVFSLYIVGSRLSSDAGAAFWGLHHFVGLNFRVYYSCYCWLVVEFS